MADNMFIYSGANTMRILMDQERKHWLLKTDKSKTLQDKVTGDMFKSVIDTCANGIVFKHEKNGNWVVSLYNIDSEGKHWNNDYFHCGEFMKEHYKGGGHPGAAGCTLTEAQFIKVLKSKTIIDK